MNKTPKEYHRVSTSSLLQFINENVTHKNVMIVSGARQVGKTTLIKSILKDKPHLYINLEEKPSVADQIDRCVDFTDFESFLKERCQFDLETQILCIDEAQKSVRLGSFVGFMKENWEGATVILTGSLINELHNETPRRPVGRETFLDLWPMTFREFVAAMEQTSLVTVLDTFRPGNTITPMQHTRLLELFDQYLFVGGLPEIVTQFREGLDFQTRRRDIFKTYEDDFVRYFSQENINLFRRAISAVADHVGSLSKDTHVVENNRPGYRKVAGIFSRLEKWKLIIKCEQIGISPEHNARAPKRYLYDVGVLCEYRLRGLEQISVTQIDNPLLRIPLGGIVENALALSLRNQFGDALYGLQLSPDAEVDFLVKHDRAAIPIECKMSLKFKTSYLSGLATYLKKTQSKNPAFLFYGGMPLTEPTAGCFIVPYYFCDSVKR
ncbi:MAG TPA: AAA family ATPase, partial [bacterium]|nr:AAA family ATPase [bacterium]